MAKRHRFNSVTVDGQFVSNRMALTGGYIDSKKSKIIA
jgi:chromosome segregation ATPase